MTHNFLFAHVCHVCLFIGVPMCLLPLPNLVNELTAWSCLRKHYNDSFYLNT